MSDAPLIANALATSLKPLLRQIAHQLTLMGHVKDGDEFARNWLGSFDAYDRLRGYTLLELADVVQSLEFGLGLQECIYQSDWEQAQSDRDSWQARVRLSALRLMLVRLRRWKRESGWQTVMFD